MIARFGIYEVDVGRVEVRCGGVPVSVQPQVFSVIEFLLVHRDRVVSKEELLDSVWGDRFVSESALTSRIKSARRALGDSGEAQAVIRTVVGRGYRWVAELEPDATTDATDRHEVPVAASSAEDRSGPPARASVPSWPPPANRFVGRDVEMARIAESLDRARLVTLVGPGGVGKTRIAMELVQDRAEEVVAVELAGVERGDDVGAAIASRLGLEIRTDDPVAAIIERLSIDAVILVLDNCEHLLDEVREIAERVVRETRRARVVATSRRRLGLADEHIERIEPLGLGDTADTDAVALLLERLRQAGLEPSADDRVIAADVCRIVDGLPLAIELAASRAVVFGLTMVRDQLRDGVPILDAGVSDERRQSTMRALVEWSTQLLSEPAHDLFLRLSVFPASFPLAAAESIAQGADVVAGVVELVESTLLIADRHSSPMRYRMLQPVRHMGRELLAAEAGLATQCSAAHAAWVLTIGDAAESAKQADDTAPAHRLIEASHADIRSALHWLVDRGEQESVDRFARQVAELIAERPDLELFRLIDDAVGDSIDGQIARIDLAASGQGDVVWAAEMAHALLAALPEDDPRWGSLTHSAGVVYNYVGDPGGGVEAFTAVIESEHATGRDRADAAVAWAMAEIFSGGRARARTVLTDHADVIGDFRLSGLVACARAEVERDRADDALELIDAASEEAERAGATLIVRMSELIRLSLLVREGDEAEALRLGSDLVADALRAGLVTLAWNAVRQIVRTLDGGPHDEQALLIRAAREVDPRASRLRSVTAQRNDRRWKISEEVRGHAATEAIRHRGAAMTVTEVSQMLSDLASTLP